MKHKKRQKPKSRKRTEKYQNINLTAKFMRFLKYHNAYKLFTTAILLTHSGMYLYDTFVFLHAKRHQEKYANDPIKWLYMHNDEDEKFISSIFSTHILWGSTPFNSPYWMDLEEKWKGYISSNFSHDSIGRPINPIASLVIDYVSPSYFYAKYLWQLCIFINIPLILALVISITSK